MTTQGVILIVVAVIGSVPGVLAWRNSRASAKATEVLNTNGQKLEERRVTLEEIEARVESMKGWLEEEKGRADAAVTRAVEAEERATQATADAAEARTEVAQLKVQVGLFRSALTQAGIPIPTLAGG